MIWFKAGSSACTDTPPSFDPDQTNDDSRQSTFVGEVTLQRKITIYKATVVKGKNAHDERAQRDMKSLNLTLVISHQALELVPGFEVETDSMYMISKRSSIEDINQYSYRPFANTRLHHTILPYPQRT